MIGKEGAVAGEVAKLGETVPLVQGRRYFVALSGLAWEVEAAFPDAALQPFFYEESGIEQIFAVFVVV